MSYSFSKTCFNCKKVDVCTDHVEIQKALDNIHSVFSNNESGHCGAGEIILLCYNYEKQ